MKIGKDFKKIFHFTKPVKQQRRDHYHKKPNQNQKLSRIAWLSYYIIKNGGNGHL